MGLDPNHQITEDDIHNFELPDEIGFKWKDLARVLGYIEAIIETIEKEKRNSNRECCIELLVRWLRRKGRDATAGKLAEALTRIELKNLADRLIKTNDQSQFEKTMITLREEGSKMSATIKEMEKEGSKMSARIKELEEEGNNFEIKIRQISEQLASLKQEVTKGKSVKNFLRKKENSEDACNLDSCSVRRDS